MTVCQMCADEGRAGTCARLRCYCGHEACWAFDSYVALPAPTRTAPVASSKAQQMRESWDKREGSTWIDEL